jgi:hypothetical protein
MTTPKIVEVESGQDVILVVNGVAVLYIEAGIVRKTTMGYGADALEFDKHDYCAYGVTLSNNSNSFMGDRAYISGCSSTLALDVPMFSTPESITAALAVRQTPRKVRA